MPGQVCAKEKENVVSEDMLGMIGFILVVALVIILQHREHIVEIKASKRRDK